MLVALKFHVNLPIHLNLASQGLMFCSLPRCYEGNESNLQQLPYSSMSPINQPVLADWHPGLLNSTRIAHQALCAAREAFSVQLLQTSPTFSHQPVLDDTVRQSQSKDPSADEFLGLPSHHLAAHASSSDNGPAILLSQCS